MCSQQLSIVSVCLNNLQGLKKTKNSILAQGQENIDWVVIDGGSTDGTKGYLEADLIGVAKFISEKDRSLYHAMNKGLELVKGDYVIFLNVGDTFADRSTVSKLKQTFSDADFIYGDSIELTPEGQRLYKKSYSHKRAWYGMFTHHQAMIYNRNTIDALRYREKFIVGADYAFTLEFIKRSKKVVKLDFPICVFEQGGFSMSNKLQGRKDQWNIQKEILGIGLLPRTMLRFLKVISQFINSKLSSLYKILRFSW